MTEKWINKIAIVTGSSSGIGAAVFKDLLKRGLVVIGLDISIENTLKFIEDQETSDQKAFAFSCNVADGESVTETFRKIEDNFDFVHIIVNCAGIGRCEIIKPILSIIDTVDIWKSRNFGLH